MSLCLEFQVTPSVLTSEIDRQASTENRQDRIDESVVYPAECYRRAITAVKKAIHVFFQCNNTELISLLVIRAFD